MRDANDHFGIPLPDAVRTTNIGRILRRYRLDELPELWMIAVGDMSFVGPRPLPSSVIEANEISQRRCRFRPGLTGLSQISGNTLLSNREKFAIDLYYVDHQSLWGDIRILFATFTMIICGERRDETLIGKALEYASHIDRCSR